MYDKTLRQVIKGHGSFTTAKRSSHSLGMVYAEWGGAVFAIGVYGSSLSLLL